MRFARAILLMGAGWVFAHSPVAAQSVTPTGGASGLLQAGLMAYKTGEYPKAEGVFTQFLSGYGGSAEAKAYLEQVVQLLALSLLQQQKFEAALPLMERYLKEYPQGDAVPEISYWFGASQYVLQDYNKAYPALTAFAQKYPADDKAEQVQLMRGMCQLATGKHAAAVKIFSENRAQFSTEMQGQVLPVILHCQMELKQWDEVVREAGQFDPYAEGLDSLSRMNLLLIQAGTGLMSEERYRDALLVLQKAWPQQRILSRQEKRLETLQEKLRREQARGGLNQDEVLALQQRVSAVTGDLEQVKSIEGYDTALRYRIARCFYALERYREAYLVFALMVKQLPVSELLQQSNYQMLVSLTRMERWQEAIQEADVFAEQFKESPLLVNVLYLQAEAMMRLFRYEDAALVFNEIVNRFEGFAEVERCHFLAGYCYLMVERNQEAVEHFQRHLERWPAAGKSKFSEQAVYWTAMAHYYDKQYQQSRAAHADYRQQYPQGSYGIDSEYRMAHALFGQSKFIEAYKELEAFIQSHPDTLLADEARNLLGDCYFSMGEVDRGMEVYHATTQREGRLYDYAQFRIGKALKAMEQYDAMRQHFTNFLQKRPESSRVTEALSQLAWLHRNQDEPELARDLYWESIRNYGNDPEAAGVEEMMRTLAKYYRGDKREEYDVKLAEMAGEAERSGQPTLASRAWWMRAQLKPAGEIQAARELFNRAAAVAPPRQMSPVVLADVADSLRTSGKVKSAQELYRTMLAWYPRSLFKDRAYAGLGLICQQQDQPSEALRYYGLFERETVESPLWADVLQSRAALYQQQGNLNQAVQELERILEIQAARGKPWVEALYQVGEIHLKQQQPKKAIPYFQRIYIMYGRWSDYVAKAYWESGQAFEDLQMRDEAVNTYREFANNTHLKDMPEYQQAVDRLKQMGEPLIEPAPAPVTMEGGA
jgi:TolA-binding protein